MAVSIVSPPAASSLSKRVERLPPNDGGDGLWLPIYGHPPGLGPIHPAAILAKLDIAPRAACR